MNLKRLTDVIFPKLKMTKNAAPYFDDYNSSEHKAAKKFTDDIITKHRNKEAHKEAARQKSRTKFYEKKKK